MMQISLAVAEYEEADGLLSVSSLVLRDSLSFFVW